MSSLDKEPSKSEDTQSSENVPKTRHRAFLLEINNPIEKGYTHEVIKEKLLLSNPLYFCMADEIGLESKLFHTHVYVMTTSAIRWTTMKSRFPIAHIEPAYGSPQQNVDYVKKEGRWLDSDKRETSVEGSFEEWGTMPKSASEKKDALDQLVVQQLEAKVPVMAIIKENPNLWRYKRHMDDLAYAYAIEENEDKLRDVTVTYIYGRTGVGKTSFVFDQFGYANVFHMYNYRQKNAIFDGYDTLKHKVIMMDEFLGNQSVSITDMNILLAPFPITNATARYQNKVISAEQIFILSNLSWEDMYSYERTFEPKIYKAFARRVHNVWEMKREVETNKLAIIQHKQTKEVKGLDTKDIIFINLDITNNS